MDKRKKPLKHNKIIDDTLVLSAKQGNGTLKYTMSVDGKGRIARYSMTLYEIMFVR